MTNNKEIFVELAKISQESFFNRRNYEWKINFGLWSAIGLWTYFTLNNSNSISYFLNEILVFRIYVLIFVGYLIWQLSIRTAFEADKQWKHYYMHRAEGKVERSPSENKISVWKSVLKWNQLSYTISQSLITLLFLLLSYFLINYASTDGKSGKEEIILEQKIPDSPYTLTVKKLIKFQPTH